MNIEEIRDYLLSQPNVTEDNAFGEDILNYRIYNKIFACMTLETPDHIAMKCDPERALDLRDRYTGIVPAWHWNKKYWNDVYFEHDVPDELIRELVQHAMSEVKKKLPKGLRSQDKRQKTI
ncbi:MAG: MmcQ/YjbR family DNA-binding protein [Paludibacteraceae bacterium]